MPNYFYIQDQGVFVPTNQLAQAFAALNIVEKNSLGIGTDTLKPISNIDNPNWIADLQSKDLWGFSGSGDQAPIYRMTKVGIKNDNPTDDCDITGTLRATDTVRFTKNDDATNSTDGTLRVTGGVGISKRLFVGSNEDSTSTSTGAVQVTGGVGVTKKVFVGDDEDSTSTVTGALRVSGGVGVTKKVFVGDDQDSTSAVTGALRVSGGVGVTKKVFVGDVEDSTSAVTGALRVSGGVGVTKKVFVGDTEDSTNSTNGALRVVGGVGIGKTLNVGGATSISQTLNVEKATTLQTTLQVGIAGTVITTTGIGSVGIGTNLPSKGLDIANQVLLQKALYDSNRNVGYKTEFYKTPRTVLGQVGVNTAGEVISDRFFDAANLIRLNLDFIAAEAVGFITSTDYLSGSFSVPGVSSCRDDIKKILKSITLDITKGGNSQSVGAGLSYYSGGSLIHITSGAQQTATIVAITTAAQISQRVINNTALTKSYQSGVSSIRQIKDLTIQDDASVGSNSNPAGCANVVSAIYTCAGIVTAIIGGGPGSAPPRTEPDGKVVWVPPGTDVRNLVWVNKYGNDDNGGRTEGDAKLTIAAAAAVAQPGDTIMVRSGVYYENNPIGLRTDVSVTGQDLRLVTVVPQNSGKDVFHVRRGCLVENMNFACDTGQSNPGGGAVAFPPTDSTKFAVSGFIASGPATEGPSGRWRSPYIRNCTNFMPLSIGMKIDGNHATASSIGGDLKSMVCDSFTQYNEAGIGVSITNNGYAQLVSIFTINCDIAIYCDTGGSCDLTNSNSSFGNFGLVAVGLGATEFTGQVLTATTEETDTIVIQNIRDTSNLFRRPFDGQAIWFKDVGPGIALTAPLRRLARVEITNKGSGYSASSPPNVRIEDQGGNTLPDGPEGIIAEVSATVDDETGQLSSIDVINSGRNYLPSQILQATIEGNATATAITEPIYFTVESSTDSSLSGIATVTLAEIIPYLVGAGTSVEFRRISRILTSGHSFEYIGTGTDINISTPFQGSIPIKENEVVARDGARIPFTSTDQQGNFDIGEGIRVDQTTNTIRGRDFSKAIQAEVTPLILALR